MYLDDSRLTKVDAGGYFVTNCQNCPGRGLCVEAKDCITVLVNRLAIYEVLFEAHLTKLIN